MRYAIFIAGCLLIVAGVIAPLYATSHTLVLLIIAIPLAFFGGRIVGANLNYVTTNISEYIYKWNYKRKQLMNNLIYCETCKSYRKHSYVSYLPICNNCVDPMIEVRCSINSCYIRFKIPKNVKDVRKYAIKALRKLKTKPDKWKIEILKLNPSERHTLRISQQEKDEKNIKSILDYIESLGMTIIQSTYNVSSGLYWIEVNNLPDNLPNFIEILGKDNKFNWDAISV